MFLLIITIVSANERNLFCLTSGQPLLPVRDGRSQPFTRGRGGDHIANIEPWERATVVRGKFTVIQHWPITTARSENQVEM